MLKYVFLFTAWFAAASVAASSPQPALAQTAQQAPRQEPKQEHKEPKQTEAGAPAAANPSETQRQQQAAALEAALHAAHDAATQGPASVLLLDQATLAVPKGMMFVPQAQAAALLRALGNKVSGTGPNGLIAPAAFDGDWLVVVNFVGEGYIKDDDAKNWNADELLANLKASNDEANADRRARGFPETELVGWIAPPSYDAGTHRLVWSLAARAKGGPATSDGGVNYNIYALGRDGYFSLNLVTSQAEIDKNKDVARTLLAALAYNDGKRYDQFNATTDKVAAYGLAALIGGAVAKKIGFLALLGAFFAKSVKLVGLAVLAIGAGLARLFKRSKSNRTPDA